MHKEFPELQKLLRLRGGAKPRDGYFEEFLEEFHRRQREDLMKRSARSLFWERLAVWIREMGSARWAYAGGAAYVVVMVLFFAWPKGPAPTEGLAPASHQMEAVREAEGVNILQFDPAGSEDGKAGRPGLSREF